jgi:hypothetical protein
VNRTTDVETESTVTWTETFTDGTYRYVCDPHANTLRGSFTVGNVQPPPPPPPPAKRLTGTVGPGSAISLKTAAGRKASRVAAGVYRITVRDRTNKHNFHLRGAGVNKLTRVPFRGTVTWRVRLQKGKTYRYYSDRNARKRGTVRGI